MELAVVKKRKGEEMEYHLVLPDIFIPYRRYLALTITEVIEKGKPVETCDADLKTQHSWLKEFKEREDLIFDHVKEVITESSIPSETGIPSSRFRQSCPQLEIYRQKHPASWLSILTMVLFHAPAQVIKRYAITEAPSDPIIDSS